MHGALVQLQGAAQVSQAGIRRLLAQGVQQSERAIQHLHLIGRLRSVRCLTMWHGTSVYKTTVACQEPFRLGEARVQRRFRLSIPAAIRKIPAMPPPATLS